MLLLTAFFLTAGSLSLRGAGVVWASVNLLFLLLWLHFVHRKILPFSYFKWMCKDVAPALICPFFVMLVLSPILISENRIFALTELGVFYGLCLRATVVLIKDFRLWALDMLRKIIHTLRRA